MPALATDTGLSWPLLLAGGVGVAAIAATLGLWVYFGTAVFFEMVRAGFMACF